MNKIIFETEESSSTGYQMLALFILFLAFIAVFFIPAVP